MSKPFSMVQLKVAVLVLTRLVSTEAIVGRMVCSNQNLTKFSSTYKVSHFSFSMLAYNDFSWTILSKGGKCAMRLSYVKYQLVLGARVNIVAQADRNLIANLRELS